MIHVNRRLIHQINQCARLITKKANERLEPFGLYVQAEWFQPFIGFLRNQAGALIDLMNEASVDVDHFRSPFQKTYLSN